MAFLLLTSAAFALDVSISPSTPTTDNDLTCFVDGNIDESKVYEWEINNQKVGSNYLLSHTLTKESDFVFCNVFQPTPMPSGTPTNIPVGTANVIIAPKIAPTINNAPELSLPAEIKLYGTAPVVLNVSDYLFDEETPISEIIVEYNAEDGLTVTLSEDKILTITSNGVLGEKYIYFGAADEDQGITFDVIKTITYQSQDKNNAPVVEIITPTEGQEFTPNEEIQFEFLASDLDGDSLILTVDFGDGTVVSDDYENLKSTTHSYSTLGPKHITATVKDTELAQGHDFVSIKIDHGADKENLKITDLKTFNDPLFESETTTFYRGQGLYVKFTLRDTLSGIPYPLEDVSVLARIYDESNPSFQLALERTEVLLNNGEVTWNGFLDGSYYFKLAPISLADDVLNLDRVIIELAFPVDSSTRQVTILNNPPVFDNIPHQVLQPGESINLNLANYAGDLEDLDSELTFTNSIDHANVATTVIAGSQLTVTGVSTGSTYVRLTVTDTEGDSADSLLLVRVGNGNQTENLPPVAIINHEVNNEIISLDGSDSYDVDGTIEDHIWQVDGAIFSTSEITSYTFTTEKTYTFTLTVRDNEGLTDVETLVIDYNENVSVLFPPVAVLDYTLTDGHVILDGSNSYDVDGTIEGYNWQIDGTVISSEEITEYDFESNGNYSLRLTVRDNDFLTSSVLITLEVTSAEEEFPEDKIHADCKSWPKINNLRIDGFAAIQPQLYYTAGQELPIYLKFNNKGLMGQHVHLKFVITDMNGIMQDIQDIRVELNNIKIVTTTVELPANMAPGTHVIRAYVTDGTGSGQKTAHMVVSIIQ